MEQIVINPSKTADTRTAKGPVELSTLYASSVQHICDVKLAACVLTRAINDQMMRHDWTKLSEIKQFHEDFNKCLNEGADFVKLPWYPMHVTTERHHLTDHVPDDVNLIDVIERICDIVMAGMGRSGSVHEDTLSPEVLKKAYDNTVKLLAEHTSVISVEESRRRAVDKGSRDGMSDSTMNVVNSLSNPGTES